MKARFGWDHSSWFGQFASVAAGVLGAALFGLVLTALVFARYEGRLASGAIDAPVLVVGADISDVARVARVSALSAALKSKVPSLPWRHALRHRARGVAPVESLFFPVNGIGDAFALCAQLAAVPPGCAPAVVSTKDLEEMDGAPVDAAAIRRLGIAPYKPPHGRIHLAATERSRAPAAVGL